MASSVIHLAVAKEYYKHHFDLDYDMFIKGTLYPDACEDKDAAHYTNPKRGKSNFEHVQGKVRLYAFLKDHPTLDSFTLGWFLHLTTDYLFFDSFFSKEYLDSHTYEEFCHDLYYGYNCLTDYLTSKYHVLERDYQAYPGEYYPGIGYHECIFNIEDMDNFITKTSKIDIPKYITKIREVKQNVNP